MAKLKLNPKQTALLIQDLQNDVIIEKGAFADSGAPQHAKEQNVVANVKKLAAAFRKAGAPVIHVWYIVEKGAPGLKLNAPLFEGVSRERARPRLVGREARRRPRAEARRLRRREDADVRAGRTRSSKRCSPGSASTRSSSRGAWTNMSIEHTARTGADKGYYMVVPEDCCSTMNADWHNASINYALQNVSTVTDGKSVAAALGADESCADVGAGLSRPRRRLRLLPGSSPGSSSSTGARSSPS